MIYGNSGGEGGIRTLDRVVRPYNEPSCGLLFGFNNLRRNWTAIFGQTRLVRAQLCSKSAPRRHLSATLSPHPKTCCAPLVSFYYSGPLPRCPLWIVSGPKFLPEETPHDCASLINARVQTGSNRLVCLLTTQPEAPFQPRTIAFL
jgi:hypothetical protein